VNPTEIEWLIDRLKAWSRDETLGDGMLLREAAAALRQQEEQVRELENRAADFKLERNQVVDQFEKIYEVLESAPMPPTYKRKWSQEMYDDWYSGPRKKVINDQP